MPSIDSKPLRSAVRFALVILPILLSMYLLYRLEYGGILTIETPHRGKISVSILGVGVVLSFLVFCLFAAQRGRR